jgi:hypothetical protein
MVKRNSSAINNANDIDVGNNKKSDCNHENDVILQSSILSTSSSTSSSASSSTSSSTRSSPVESPLPSPSSSKSSSSNSLVRLLENNIEEDDHPHKMQENVMMTIQKWGAVSAIPPAEFLSKLLGKRGYSSKTIPALKSQYRRIPTDKQLNDYDIQLVNAVRTSDLDSIKKMKESGMCMSACNQYSESIIHMACRRSEYNVIEYMLQNGGDIQIVDDYGRTPLHDACWRPEPRFDIVTLLLDRNPYLLQLLDIRGSTPLNYVREVDWLQWCAYIFYCKERYWASK